jgi:uncharacterized membrane protein/nitrite reductase/ring-hydroxylating ferredoxin subunit
MKSKASVYGHPIHPMLITFPFAFLTGAVLFDVAGWYFDDKELSSTGAHLTVAGVGAGLLAALPGIVDYFGSVPPESSAKTRATQHAITNVSALTIFAVSWFVREDGDATLLTLAAQLVGLAAMSIAGWMGGTLVYRNQIGVDHRYAEAGKWQEERVERSGDRVVVADSDDLNVNQMKLVHVDGKRIVVGRTDHGCAAFDDRCTHKGGPLSDGVLICGIVQCPWHGSQFDVTTGEVKCGPAKKKIKTHHVEESNGQVRLGV